MQFAEEIKHKINLTEKFSLPKTKEKNERENNASVLRV
jgi:hypothetical protein